MRKHWALIGAATTTTLVGIHTLLVGGVLLGAAQECTLNCPAVLTKMAAFFVLGLVLVAIPLLYAKKPESRVLYGWMGSAAALIALWYLMGFYWTNTYTLIGYGGAASTIALLLVARQRTRTSR